MNVLRTHVYNDGERGRMELHRTSKHCEFLNEVTKFKRYVITFSKGMREECFYWSVFNLWYLFCAWLCSCLLV